MHCSPLQQERIAAILDEILGDSVFTCEHLASDEMYPSPHQLKHKFIVKCKRPKQVETDEPTALPGTLTRLIGMPGCKWDTTVTRPLSSICSVTSKKLKKLTKSHTVAEIVDIHKRHFTRVYPSGLKIDSSNYNPIDAWVTGAHMVALNM
jgi:phosphatidylinositol phospholipase C delta